MTPCRAGSRPKTSIRAADWMISIRRNTFNICGWCLEDSRTSYFHLMTLFNPSCRFWPQNFTEVMIIFTLSFRIFISNHRGVTSVGYFADRLRPPSRNAELVMEALLAILSAPSAYTKFTTTLPLTRICILLLDEYPTTIVATRCFSW